MKNLFYLFISIIILTQTLYSQKWEEVPGPAGGNVNCFAANASHLFIGNENGIFISKNDGYSWDHKYFSSVSKMFAVKDKLIALSGKNLITSGDNGATWEYVPTIGINDIILYKKQVFALSRDYIIVFDTVAGNWGRTDFMKSVNFNKFFIDEDIFLGYKEEFNISEDFGVTWNHIPTLDYVNIIDITKYHDDILAITNSSLLIIDYKKGKQSIISNFEPGVKLFSMYLQNDSLFIACSDRIMLTTDEGKTFSTIKLPYKYTDLRITKFGNIFYAGMSPYGLFTSLEIGKNWKNTGIYKQDVKYLNSIDGILFASSDYTTFSSSDFAKTWDVSQIIYENLVTPAVKIIKHKNTIFSVSRLGIFPFNVLTKKWIMDNEQLLYQPIVDIATNDSIIIVCMNLNWFFISYDDAASWSTINIPNISNVGFLGDTLLANNFISLDKGNNWQSIPLFPNAGKYQTHGDKIYIVRRPDSVLSYSSDLGTSWNDLPVNIENSKIRTFCIIDDNIVAATIDNRIYTCPADNYVWKNITFNFLRDTVNTFAFDGNYLYTGTDNGIYRISYLAAKILNVINEQNNVDLFPNPSDGNFSISYSGDAMTKPKIEILSVFGEKVMSINAAEYSSDINVINLNCGDLQPGMYICRINFGNFVNTQKFIIKR